MRTPRLGPITPPIQDAERPAGSPASERSERARPRAGARDADPADAVERAAYRWLSTVSYSRLFKADEESLWPFWARIPILSPRERIAELSRENVARLQHRVSPLNGAELAFYRRFVATRLFAVHFTRTPLAPVAPDPGDTPPATLRLYSNANLRARRVSFTEGAGEGERDSMGNGDFVFFSLEVGAQPRKPTSRFGSVRYRFDVDRHAMLREDAWVSMDDMHLEKLGLAPDRPTPLVMGLLQPFDRMPASDAPNGRLSTHVFFGGDVRRGMALALIDRIRFLRAPESRDALLRATSDDELNRVLNGLFRPEMKVPRAFIGTPSPDPA